MQNENRDTMKISSQVKKYKFKQSIWSDEIGEMIQHRNIIINEIESIIKSTTKNRTIIVYAVEFKKEQQNPNSIIPIIDYIQLYKKILLLVELLGVNGRKKTFKLKNVFPQCCIKLKVKFLTINQLS